MKNYKEKSVKSEEKSKKTMWGKTIRKPVEVIVITWQLKEKVSQWENLNYSYR